MHCTASVGCSGWADNRRQHRRRGCVPSGHQLTSWKLSQLSRAYATPGAERRPVRECAPQLEAYTKRVCALREGGPHKVPEAKCCGGRADQRGGVYASDRPDPPGDARVLIASTSHHLVVITTI
jgi:hypothetical protein